MRFHLQPRRVAVHLVAYLVLGFVAAVGVAWGLSATMDVTLGPMHTAESYSSADDARWTVTRWTRGGGALVVSKRAADRAWGSRQAAGPPDTQCCGDIVTAWASATQDGQPEWLELTYERAVVPSEVRIHETYNVGAVTKVTAFTADGREVEAWEGQDPLALPGQAATPQQTARVQQAAQVQQTAPPRQQAGVAKIPVKLDFPVRRIKIYIDSPRVQSWNEIDAVGLVDASGNVQWATGVRASSVYNAPTADTTTTPAPSDLAPRWGQLARPGDAFTANKVKTETRAVAAHGWPMLAFWDERDADVAEAQAQAAQAQAAQAQLTRLQGAQPQLSGGLIQVNPVPPGSGGAAPNSAYVTYSLDSSIALTPLPAAPNPQPQTPTAAPTRTRMPMRPIWSGLVVNTLVFAAAIALLHALAVWPARLARQVSRVRSGRCLECGYDLGYDYLNGCPECGWRRAATSREDSRPVALAGVAD